MTLRRKAAIARYSSLSKGPKRFYFSGSGSRRRTNRAGSRGLLLSSRASELFADQRFRSGAGALPPAAGEVRAGRVPRGAGGDAGDSGSSALPPGNSRAARLPGTCPSGKESNFARAAGGVRVM